MRKTLLIITVMMSLLMSGYVTASPININQATAEQLAENLRGIGLKKAQAIIQYREKVGTFQSQEQLLNVKGIGASTLEKNKANILFE